MIGMKNSTLRKAHGRPRNAGNHASSAARTRIFYDNNVTALRVPSTRERIMDYIAQNPVDGPCLFIDNAAVRRNYIAFEEAMPQARIFYAVKANPAPEILTMLAHQGSCFDTASTVEIDMAFEAGATADRISFGNTIKKERDIAYAHARGITMFAVDCFEEVEKVSRAAPGARVYCRILVDNVGAEWPLSRKFGCAPEMAVDVLDYAKSLGLDPYGVSFHPGSQQANLEAWDSALGTVAGVFAAAKKHGINLRMVNMGGGFPTRYLKDVPGVPTYGAAITGFVNKYFDTMPEIIIEPGRGMVGDAGIIKSEVVLISRKSAADPVRWVYLDIGKFGGLAETMDESIRYPITTDKDDDDKTPCIIAGPTCDSVDVLYEKTPYPLPHSLAVGDNVFIEATGAYTTTYASVAFNGFPPLQAVVIP